MPQIVQLGPELLPGVREIIAVHGSRQLPPTFAKRPDFRTLPLTVNERPEKLVADHVYADDEGLKPKPFFMKLARRYRRSCAAPDGIVWGANHFGHGNSFRWFNYSVVDALLKLGVPTRILTWRPGHIDPALKFQTVERDEDMARRIAILNTRWSPPKHVMYRGERYASAHLGYFQCEGTRVSPANIAWFNSFDAMLATSTVTKQALEASGLTVPVHVFGHGIDPALLPFVERSADRRPYTFFHLADVQVRKGTDLVIKAFSAITRPDVRLHIKAQAETIQLMASSDAKLLRATARDPRIVWDTKNYAPHEMRELLGRMDCGVFPSRAEGFGLPPLECRATGMPVIVTRAFGFLDYASEESDYLLDVASWEEALFDGGEQAEPSLNHLAHLMETCAENPAEALRKGRLASEGTHRNWKWSNKAAELVGVLGAYGLQQSPHTA